MSTEIHEPDAARAEEPAPSLSRDILEGLTTLVKRAGTIGHSIAADFKVSPPDLFALFKLEGGIAMKELAQRMACDASFVTAVADTLEKRGFIRREASQRDRRIKNLVLTSEGTAAKERLMAQLAAKMPWSYALDEAEQRCLLRLLRKMLDTPVPEGATGARPGEQADQEPAGQPASLTPGQPAGAPIADYRDGLAGTHGAAAEHEQTGVLAMFSAETESRTETDRNST